MADTRSDHHSAAADCYQVPLHLLETWSAAQAGEVCGVSANTFKKWVNNGDMPPAYGKTGRWSAQQVRQRLAEMESKSKPKSVLQEWEENDG